MYMYSESDLTLNIANTNAQRTHVNVVTPFFLMLNISDQLSLGIPLKATRSLHYFETRILL